MAYTSEQLDWVAATAALRAMVEGELTAAVDRLARLGLRPEVIRDEVIRLVRELVRQYGEAAAAFAADWYDDYRAMLRVPGSYRADVFTQDWDAAIEGTVRRLTGGLFEEVPAVEGFVRGVAERASQYAIDGARTTIIENSWRDPESVGWMRVPQGPTCLFCLMLAGRGAVYKRQTVRFRAHLNCDCGAAPSFDPDAVEVPNIAYEGSERLNELRRRAAEGDKSAERQLEGYRKRARSWIAEHREELVKFGESIPNVTVLR